jgi:hypothetical protein
MWKAWNALLYEIAAFATVIVLLLFLKPVPTGHGGHGAPRTASAPARVEA